MLLYTVVTSNVVSPFTADGNIATQSGSLGDPEKVDVHAAIMEICDEFDIRCPDLGRITDTIGVEIPPAEELLDPNAELFVKTIERYISSRTHSGVCYLERISYRSARGRLIPFKYRYWDPGYDVVSLVSAKGIGAIVTDIEQYEIGAPTTHPPVRVLPTRVASVKYVKALLQEKESYRKLDNDEELIPIVESETESIGRIFSEVSGQRETAYIWDFAHDILSSVDGVSDYETELSTLLSQVAENQLGHLETVAMLYPEGLMRYDTIADGLGRPGPYRYGFTLDHLMREPSAAVAAEAILSARLVMPDDITSACRSNLECFQRLATVINRHDASEFYISMHVAADDIPMGYTRFRLVHYDPEPVSFGYNRIAQFAGIRENIIINIGELAQIIAYEMSSAMLIEDLRLQGTFGVKIWRTMDDQILLRLYEEEDCLAGEYFLDLNWMSLVGYGVS